MGHSYFSLFGRQNAWRMVYVEANTFKDAKQLDVQKMTIYCPQNHFKGQTMFRLTPLNVGTKNVILRHHDVILIKNPDKWFA